MLSCIHTCFNRRFQLPLVFRTIHSPESSSSLVESPFESAVNEDESSAPDCFVDAEDVEAAAVESEEEGRNSEREEEGKEEGKDESVVAVVSRLVEASVVAVLLL